MLSGRNSIFDPLLLQEHRYLFYPPLLCPQQPFLPENVNLLTPHSFLNILYMFARMCALELATHIAEAKTIMLKKWKFLRKGTFIVVRIVIHTLNETTNM